MSYLAILTLQIVDGIELELDVSLTTGIQIVSTVFAHQQINDDLNRVEKVVQLTALAAVGDLFCQIVGNGCGKTVWSQT
jgi:hypothetical protein